MLSRISSYSKNCFSNIKNNALWTASAVMSLLPVAQAASACFENKDSFGDSHDYTLNCATDVLLHNAMSALNTSCAIFNDGLNDCATFFQGSLQFGHGYFGGSLCELSFHPITACLDNKNVVVPCLNNVPSKCIVDTLNNNVKDGFGSNEDLLATVGIVATSALVLASVGHCCHRFFSVKAKNTTPTPSLEAGSVNADPSERSPLVAKK